MPLHHDGHEGFRRAGSAGAYARMYGLDQLPWDEKMIEHPAYDAFWQGQALDKLVSEHPSQVPTMWIQGLWDQEDMWGDSLCLALKRGRADHNYPAGYGTVEAQPSELRRVQSRAGRKWEGDTATQFRRGYQPFFDQYLKTDAPKS